jgi:hypothetical protein
MTAYLDGPSRKSVRLTDVTVPPMSLVRDVAGVGRIIGGGKIGARLMHRRAERIPSLFLVVNFVMTLRTSRFGPSVVPLLDMSVSIVVNRLFSGLMIIAMMMNVSNFEGDAPLSIAWM